MFRLLFVFVLSLAVSSQAIAAVKWNNSGGSSITNEAWIPEIKTQLHDLDISTAKFKFVNRQLEKVWLLFPTNEFKFWGFNRKSTDIWRNQG